MTTLLRPVLRGVLTVGYLYFGLQKLLGAESAVALYDALGFGQAPRYVTGTVETLGAVALWTPVAPLAALALIATMIIGFTAKLTLVGPPVWHIAALGLATLALLILDRRRAGAPRLDSRPPSA